MSIGRALVIKSIFKIMHLQEVTHVNVCNNLFSKFKTHNVQRPQFLSPLTHSLTFSLKGAMIYRILLFLSYPKIIYTPRRGIKFLMRGSYCKTKYKNLWYDCIVKENQVDKNGNITHVRVKYLGHPFTFFKTDF